MGTPVSGPSLDDGRRAWNNRDVLPLILALGNPILGDDRVGLEVARRLHERLPQGSAALLEASVGGIELLHVLEGWRRVVIIDAIEPGTLAPGEVAEVVVSDLEPRSTPLTPHHAGLGHALALGRTCGLAMPAEVLLFAVGVRDPYTFAERCTPEVEAAIPGIVERIHERVFGDAGCWPVRRRGDAVSRPPAGSARP